MKTECQALGLLLVTLQAQVSNQCFSERAASEDLLHLFFSPLINLAKNLLIFFFFGWGLNSGPIP
jgi:hypothetical protein